MQERSLGSVGGRVPTRVRSRLPSSAAEGDPSGTALASCGEPPAVLVDASIASSRSSTHTKRREGPEVFEISVGGGRLPVGGWREPASGRMAGGSREDGGRPPGITRAAGREAAQDVARGGVPGGDSRGWSPRSSRPSADGRPRHPWPGIGPVSIVSASRRSLAIVPATRAGVPLGVTYLRSRSSLSSGRLRPQVPAQAQLEEAEMIRVHGRGPDLIGARTALRCYSGA